MLTHLSFCNYVCEIEITLVVFLSFILFFFVVPNDYFHRASSRPHSFRNSKQYHTTNNLYILPSTLFPLPMPMLQLSHGHAAPSSSELLCAIEHMFLQRRFEEALRLSFSALLEVSEDRDLKNKGKTKEPYSNLQVENVTSEILNLQHRCTHPDCKCVSIMSLLIQILFEMGRSQDVLPCAANFYGDLMQTPYDVLFLWYAPHSLDICLINSQP